MCQNYVNLFFLVLLWVLFWLWSWWLKYKAMVFVFILIQGRFLLVNTCVSAGTLSYLMKVNAAGNVCWHRITETPENGRRLRAIDASLSQTGDEASHSLSSSFAFYGSNALLSNILHHPFRTHALRNCAFWCETAFPNIFVTDSRKHLLAAGVCQVSERVSHTAEENLQRKVIHVLGSTLTRLFCREVGKRISNTLISVP